MFYHTHCMWMVFLLCEFCYVCLGCFSLCGMLYPHSLHMWMMFALVWVLICVVSWMLIPHSLHHWRGFSSPVWFSNAWLSCLFLWSFTTLIGCEWFLLPVWILICLVRLHFLCECFTTLIACEWFLLLCEFWYVWLGCLFVWMIHIQIEWFCSCVNFLCD